MAEVLGISRREWLFEEFRNDGQEVVKGANGTEWWIGRVAQNTAGSGQ